MGKLLGGAKALKGTICHKICLKMSYFVHKLQKSLEAGGSAPRPLCLRRLETLPPDPRFGPPPNRNSWLRQCIGRGRMQIKVHPVFPPEGGSWDLGYGVHTVLIAPRFKNFYLQITWFWVCHLFFTFSEKMGRVGPPEMTSSDRLNTWIQQGPNSQKPTFGINALIYFLPFILMLQPWYFYDKKILLGLPGARG